MRRYILLCGSGGRLVTFLRESSLAAGLLTMLRLFLGWSWLTAGWGKISDGFDATGYLTNAVNNPVKGPDGDLVYGWYVTFLENFVVPNVEFFNFMIPWGEFLVGLGLILGMLTTAAMFFGLLMNFSFMMAGTVSHNPADVFWGALILFAGFNAGKYGLDYWVIPYVRKTFLKRKSAR